MRTKLSIFCGYLIEAGWLAAVVSVPLFFNIYTARTFEPDKITLLRSIAGLMILAWLIMVVEQGIIGAANESRSLGERFREWLKKPMVSPTLALVLIYLISTMFSISPNVSVWGSYQRLQGTYSALSYIVIFALMASNLRSREQVDRLVTVMIVTSVPVSLYGVVQRYGLDPLPWAGNVTIRVASNMGNPIFVASYLIMVTPLTVSRLVEAMTSIVKDKNSSWANTILAAVYIFAIAVQLLTVLFSGSRGPMLGILASFAIMGLLFLLILRQLNPGTEALSFKEIGLGAAFIIPLGIAGALGAGAGFLITFGLERLFAGLGYEADSLPLIGVAIGGLIGLLGLYVYMAAARKGWRWMWVSWISLGTAAVLLVLALNVRGLGFDAYLDPVRELPFVSQLSRITITDSGTGKVRVLIWDAVLELIVPHEPLGIQGDAVATQEDSFVNFLRPLIGYGPESMFNAFAYVYPPDLAHVEARGSSADRSHNETMDSLVITGFLGFLAFYFLMVSIFYYIMRWLGWVPDKPAQTRLVILLITGGLAGAVIPYLADGSLTFIALGLPFGLVAGMVIHVIWQGLVRQPEAANHRYSVYTLLMIGGLGAIVGHFIEVHFVFSIAATYTYFWTYAGLLVALAHLKTAELASEAEIPVPQPETVAETQNSTPPVTTRRGKKRRGRRAANVSASQPLGPTYALVLREGWDTWVGSQGLAMAIILIILTFDFVTPQFQYSLSNENSKVFFWMLIITWLTGFAITLSTLALRADEWLETVNWAWAGAVYSVTSLFYFGFYTLAHQIQFGQQVFVQATNDVLKAANVLAGGLVVFYIFLLLLLIILALTLAWRKTRGMDFWRVENWWLYPPLVLVTIALIWFKNIDVVRADVFLKEGERYRNNQQWDQAILLQKKAISIDSDEDFYYLMLALDYQLMAQDSRLDEETRKRAWQLGEQTALDARAVNPYNPDNTGNMGRYYFTLGQVISPERFNDALSFFEKAVTLAPSNIIYHNLWAQTYYILQNYDTAVDKLQTSVAIDPNFAPTWLLLGDVYAAKGEVDKALMAHSEAIKLNTLGSTDGFNSFADQFLDRRLNFYISGGRADDLIAELEKLAEERPDEGKILWAIGRIYQLQGQPEKAAPYFEQARAMGDNSERTVRELANLYLSQADYAQAEPLYQQLLQANPNDFESHSALAYLYAQQGRLDEAIQHNQAVLQQLPNDYDSLKNMAILLQQQGKYVEAMNYAQQAQTAAPDGEKPSWDQFIANLESLMSTGEGQ